MFVWLVGWLVGCIAYVEFFVSPADMAIVAAVVGKHSNLVLYSVDSSGAAVFGSKVTRLSRV